MLIVANGTRLFEDSHSGVQVWCTPDYRVTISSEGPPLLGIHLERRVAKAGAIPVRSSGAVGLWSTSRWRLSPLRVRPLSACRRTRGCADMGRPRSAAAASGPQPDSVCRVRHAVR